MDANVLLSYVKFTNDLILFFFKPTNDLIH